MFCACSDWVGHICRPFLGGADRVAAMGKNDKKNKSKNPGSRKVIVVIARCQLGEIH